MTFALKIAARGIVAAACAALVLANAACSRPAAPGAGADAAGDGCSAAASHIAAFTAAGAQDRVEARLSGPDCARAVAVLTVRTAQGQPVFAYAAPYAQLVGTRPPTPDAPAPALREVKAFLDRWANVTVASTTSLPDWPPDAAAPLGGGAGPYASPMSRAAYLALRGEDRPNLCLAASFEGSLCVVYDAQSGWAAPTLTFGGAAPALAPASAPRSE